ncbi:hypothetical protein EAE89_16740 [Photorhabdus heterorhabditis]|nr:hypothetical protein [Photorhabdus heterorhabditis]
MVVMLCLQVVWKTRLCSLSYCFFTSCTFTLSVHSDFLMHRGCGAFFWHNYWNMALLFDVYQ